MKMKHIGWVVQMRRKLKNGHYTDWDNLTYSMNRLKFQSIKSAYIIGCKYYEHIKRKTVRCVKVFVEVTTTPNDKEE